MSNDFRGEGNLGAQPTLKKVLVDGEPHSVAELRIFFDRFKSDGQGGYVPNGGGPARYAEVLARETAKYTAVIRAANIRPD